MTFRDAVDEVRLPDASTLQQRLSAHQAAVQRVERVANLRSETIERLAHQAMPAQICILQEYGGEHPVVPAMIKSPRSELGKCSLTDLVVNFASLDEGKWSLNDEGSHDDCLEKPDLVDRLLENVKTGTIVSRWAAVTLPAPKCVCGSSLIWLDGKARLRRTYEGRIADSEFDNFFERMKEQGRGGIICDVCDCKQTVEDPVWTCENGCGTILHATSYDICNDCFIRHACCEVARSSEAAEEVDASSDAMDVSGYPLAPRSP